MYFIFLCSLYSLYLYDLNYICIAAQTYRILLGTYIVPGSKCNVGGKEVDQKEEEVYKEIKA